MSDQDAPLDVTGVVLAGGEGRRMGGRAKAWLPGPDGRPLLERALAALRAAGARTLLVAAREAAPFAGLTPPPAVVLDRAADLGPLGGIEAALRGAPTEWVLVVACDMPHLDPALLRQVARAALAAGPEVLAVVPRVAGRPQPLHAAYARAALPRVQAALDAKRLRVGELVASLDPLWLEVPESASFVNWNTPEDVDRRG